jgi:hypothetical protein
LNPANLKDFFAKYENGDLVEVMSRFHLLDYSQVDQLYSYFNYLIDKQLNMEDVGGNYEDTAFSLIVM